MSIELKPCPFCGSSAKYMSSTIHGTTYERIACHNEDGCGMFTDCEHADGFLIKQWNTRHEAAKEAQQPDDCRVAFEAWATREMGIGWMLGEGWERERQTAFKAWQAGWCTLGGKVILSATKRESVALSDEAKELLAENMFEVLQDTVEAAETGKIRKRYNPLYHGVLALLERYTITEIEVEEGK